MNKYFLILFMAIIFPTGLYSKEASLMVKTQHSVDHNIWDGLLKKYVSIDGNVNYKDFKINANVLNTYIDYLSTQIPSKKWSKQEQLAYYINLYNANTIKLIIDNYPVKSIKDINNPWSKKHIKIGDKAFSLSEIENDILRKMDEPRIHFAINCASASCPRLLNTAYTSENVEELLEKATKDFIANSEKNKISKEKIQISKIFKWYKSDFNQKGSLIDYINKYSTEKILPDASISYLEYDWGLNEQH